VVPVPLATVPVAIKGKGLILLLSEADRKLTPKREEAPKSCLTATLPEYLASKGDQWREGRRDWELLVPPPTKRCQQRSVASAGNTTKCGRCFAFCQAVYTRIRTLPMSSDHNAYKGGFLFPPCTSVPRVLVL
jgi:hypothetical protein